mgnify:CR=1 FL=1
MGILSKILKGTGFSFSWKRAIGLTGLRTKASHGIGFPTTLGGIQRKIGAKILDLLFGGLSGKSGKKRK